MANPSRFRNMGASPEELAKQDYEAKMQLAFSEYYRVLRMDEIKAKVVMEQTKLSL